MAAAAAALRPPRRRRLSFGLIPLLLDAAAAACQGCHTDQLTCKTTETNSTTTLLLKHPVAAEHAPNTTHLIRVFKHGKYREIKKSLVTFCRPFFLPILFICCCCIPSVGVSVRASPVCRSVGCSKKRRRRRRDTLHRKK